MDFSNLPLQNEQGCWNAVVESPRGTRMKLKFKPSLGAFQFSRPLPLGLSYPFDWGFFPGTEAPDGDPVDVMILHDETSFPGTVIPCRLLGVIRLEQNRKTKTGREQNDRIIAVPSTAPRLDDWQDVADLPERTRQEIERFFIDATHFEEKDATICKWDSAEAAIALLHQSQKHSLSVS